MQAGHSGQKSGSVSVSRHSVIDPAGETGFLEGFLSATAHGTPEQVIERYRARYELLGSFEAAPAFRFGGVPFEEAEASMRLFAKEVLPELKSWA